MAHSIAPPGPQLPGRISTWLKKPLTHKFRSLAARGQHGIGRVADHVFDKWHRLDCGGFVPPADLDTAYAASLPHARAYEAVPCKVIRSLLDEAHKTGIVFDSFIDIGSGKGKACFYAATRGRFSKIIGVEFSGPLVDVAYANKQRFGAADLDLNFLHIDATLFSLPPGDKLVFLFNPFGEVILRKFIENNLEHFRQSRSVIAYANDKHRLCLADLGFATLFRNQETQCSLHQYLEQGAPG